MRNATSPRSELFIYLFIFLIALESSIRKYIVASPLILFLKYLFLVPIIFLFLRSKLTGLVLALIVSFLPLTLTVKAVENFPYAIYDSLGLLLAPVAICYLCISTRVRIINRPLRLLWAIALVGFANASLIIIQSILGPSHWISATVDQQFTQQVFGDFQKAPGLAASSSYLMTVAGLASLFLLKQKTTIGQQVIIIAMSIVSLLSILFNLSSRSYTFGIILFLLLIVFSAIIANKIGLVSKLLVLLVSVCTIVYASLLFLPVSTILKQIILDSRTISDFSTAESRLFSIELLTIFKYHAASLPIFFGMGLGSTVNANPYTDIYSLPSYCSQFEFGIEGEFPRLLCAFGLYGFVIIAFRALLAFSIFFSLIKNKILRKSPVFSAIHLYVSLLIVDGAQFKQNDTVAGLLLCGVAAYAARQHIGAHHVPFCRNRLDRQEDS